MEINLIGKQSFVSKKGTQCNIIHFLTVRDNVEGFAAETAFVEDSIFNKARVNGKYKVVYGCYNNGRAYIADLVEKQ